MNVIRMKKRKQFLFVAEHGIRIVSGSIIIQACPNQLDNIRIGFTVTKKIGNAVVRNRTRRRLRELGRVHPLIAKMTGFDLVFVGRLSTKDRPYPQLRRDLERGLQDVLVHNAKESV